VGVEEGVEVTGRGVGVGVSVGNSSVGVGVGFDTVGAGVAVSVDGGVNMTTSNQAKSDQNQKDYTEHWLHFFPSFQPKKRAYYSIKTGKRRRKYESRKVPLKTLTFYELCVIIIIHVITG
jgi:hypothetical protein